MFIRPCRHDCTLRNANTDTSTHTFTKNRGKMALNCSAEGTFCLHCSRYCCSSRKCLDAVVYCDECGVAPYCSLECADAHFAQHQCTCSFLCDIADTPNHEKNRKACIAMYEWIQFILHQGEDVALHAWLVHARKKFAAHGKEIGYLSSVATTSRHFVSTQHDFEKTSSVETALLSARRNMLCRSYANRSIVKAMQLMEIPEEEEITSTVKPSLAIGENVLISVPSSSRGHGLENNDDDVTETDQTPMLLQRYRERVARPGSLFVVFTLRLDNPWVSPDSSGIEHRGRKKKNHERHKESSKHGRASFVQRPTLFAFLHRPKIQEEGGIDKWSWSISVTVPPSMSKNLRSNRDDTCESDVCACFDHADAQDLPDAIPLGPLLEPMLSYLAKELKTPIASLTDASKTSVSEPSAASSSRIGASRSTQSASTSSLRSSRSKKIETDIACSSSNNKQR